MKFGFVTSLLILLLEVTFAFSNVPDALMEDGNFKTLVDALDKADLMTQLAGDGPFTIFAPTDDAFGYLPNGLLECLLENKDLLADVLKYHVVKEKILSSKDIDWYANLKTLHGDNVTGFDLFNILNYYDKEKIVGDNVILFADDLLVPPTVISNTDFTHTCKNYDFDICNSIKDDYNITDWIEHLYYEDFPVFGMTCSCQAASPQNPNVPELERQIGARITCEDAEELCDKKECFVRSRETFVYPDRYGFRTTKYTVKDCLDLNEKSFGGEKFCFIDGYEGVSGVDYDGVSINGETCNNYTSTSESVYKDDNIEVEIDHHFVDCTNLGYDEYSEYTNYTFKLTNYDNVQYKVLDQFKVLNSTTNEGPIHWFINDDVDANYTVAPSKVDEDKNYTAPSSGSYKFYAATNFIISIIIGMVVMH